MEILITERTARLFFQANAFVQIQALFDKKHSHLT